MWIAVGLTGCSDKGKEPLDVTCVDKSVDIELLSIDLAVYVVDWGEAVDSKLGITLLVDVLGD